jgi:hypothetical protein
MCTGTHPYIPVLNVAEARLQFITPGGQAENVLNFELPDSSDVAALEQLAGDLAVWFRADYQALINSGCALEQIVVTDLTTNTGPQITYIAGLPASGTGGDSLPMNVTVAVKHVTLDRGRSKRGRSYIVGPPTTAVDSGDIIATAYLTASDTAFNDLRVGDFATNNETFGIVSRCNGNSWRATGIFTPVTHSSTDRVFDSQRRRLTGRGA